MATMDVPSASEDGRTLVRRVALLTHVGEGLGQRLGHTVTTSSQLTVSLDDDSSTKIVENKCLVGFCETEFPGKTSVLDASPARRAGTSVVTRDQDVVSLGFCNTSGDNADASFRNKFDRDARPRA